MPGMFCDAMVTRNSGKPRPISAGHSKIGLTIAGWGDHEPAAPPPETARSASTTSTAAGTAYSRLNRKTNAQTTTTGSPIIGTMATARTGARHNPSSTPASMALASAGGMAATTRPSGFHSPAAMINTPQTRNAPTAAGNPPSGAPDAASSAAPGVDHAMLIGSRRQKLTRMAQTPIATASAIRPDAASAWDAPTAINPCRTTAKEEAKPTNAASTPAKTAGMSGGRCGKVQAFV